MAPTRYARETLKTTAKGPGNFVRGMDFDCEVGGVAAGGIVKVTGIKFEYETQDFKHAESNVMQCQPGHPKRVTVELHREFAPKEMKFRDDRQKVLRGEPVRTPITIKLKNHAGQPIGTIDLFNAWPSAYYMPNLTSATSAHAIERIRYECEEWKITMG